MGPGDAASPALRFLPCSQNVFELILEILTSWKRELVRTVDMLHRFNSMTNELFLFGAPGC